MKSNQDGLQCDLCDKWFHCACERVSAEHHRMLSREDSRAQWYCGACRCQVKNIKDENKKLQTENKNLIIENKTLMNCLARQEKEMDELKEDNRCDIAVGVKRIVIETMKEENLKNQSSRNGKDIGNQVKEYINIEKTEDREIEKRKNNLVFYNVRESEIEMPATRYDYDGNQCLKIFKEIGIEDFKM